MIYDEHAQDAHDAWADGWAEGEQWVMDHIWEYVLVRSRVGRWLRRVWSWWHLRRHPHLPYAAPIDQEYDR